jgi:ABC-type glycerol-3-phosphate transport system substrate-binding protein
VLIDGRSSCQSPLINQQLESRLKAFFASTFAALILLSLIAWRTKPAPVDPSKIQLTWSSDDNPLRREQIDPFNALNPTLDLALDPNNAEAEKVIVQSLAGVGPDLFDCWSGFALSAFVKADIAWDVSDELKKLGIDVATETWPAVQRTCIYQGRVYGFPVNAAANGMWFHKDIVAESGVAIPTGAWTWQQALPLLKSFVRKDDRGKTTRYGLVFDWDNNYLQFIYQWGGRMYTPDGTRCTLDSPEAIAAVQFMQDLVKQGVVPDASAEKALAAAGGWGGASVITLFGGKRAACALGGRWWLSAFRKPGYENLELGAAEAPYGTVHTFLGYGKSTLINKYSPRRHEALAFLAYLHSADYNNLINHEADGLGPVMKYAEGPNFLHDPKYPKEDFNAIWRNLQKAAVPEQVSPFMNGAVLQRIMKGQLDLIKAGDRSAEQGMREATRMVNERIQENLRYSPALRQQWEKLVKENAE